ncbi:sciellin isoform X2 [Rhineura floridana]|uniref:sciellin isoform X2 n=1 Tax=Rhineura floridana TaxID=261503 RepID=UPI002AC82E71|nr:sciellin isoform X2 [Rhineura floridana]
MASFNVGKSSPKKSDIKNASLAMKSKQQVANEVNKRRTLLHDNSWIKKKPEENTDENYGRVVLNQYKSQESLHRNADEKDDQKALLSGHTSDTTLERISGKIDADKANQLPTSDGKPNNSKELDVSLNTGNATSPVKKKRQSWMPPPVSNQKVTTDDMEQHKSVPTTSDKGGGPKMTIYSSEPITSAKSNAVVSDPARTRQVCPSKPSGSDANRAMNKEGTGRSQELDNLIEVKAKGNESDQGSQELDNLIEVKAKGNESDQRPQDLDDLIKVNCTSNERAKGGRDLDDLISVNNTAQKNRRSQELDDLIVIKSSTVDQNKNWAPDQGYESANIPDSQSEINHSYQVKRESSCNASSSCSSPKDTIVYTRTYENRFPHDAYEYNIPGKSIKTVYSTSDRAIIEKEMCTYCRKPLSTDTKMILDALQICCHATCFKCEVCKAPLENLKAGDSIWIYKNTVHCEPCYSEVRASWVY